MANIQPYRQSSEIVPEVANTYGLIVAKTPHRCNPPGYFARLWLRIKGMRVYPGSMWRCQKCGDLHELGDDDWSSQGTAHHSSPYLTSPIKRWLAMGGKFDVKEDRNI